jgi:hypothetical protein
VISVAQVFLSSTSDLGPEREAVKSAVSAPPRKIDVFDYSERFAPTDSPERVLRKEIGRSDLFFLILGARYGSDYPDSADKRQSIVEWELNTARNCGKLFGRPALFSFLKDAPEDEIAPEQRQLRTSVQAFDGGLWCKRFTDCYELKRLSDLAVKVWLWALAETDRKLAKRQKWVVVSLATCLIGFMWLSDSFSQASRPFIGAAVALPHAMALWLINKHRER